MYSQLISAINDILYSHNRMDASGVDKHTKHAIQLAQELPAAIEVLTALKNGEIISFIRNNNDYFVPLVNKITVSKIAVKAKTPVKSAKKSSSAKAKLKCFTNSFRYLASGVL